MAGFEITYDFDELMLTAYSDGVMLYGTATLIECDDTFRVEDIKLGSRWLGRCPHDGAGTFDHHLFKAISEALERDEHVKATWDKAFDELRYDRSEPDVYSAMAAE